MSTDLRAVHVLTWWTSARYLPWGTEKNYYSVQDHIEFARFAVSAAVLLVNQVFLDVTLRRFPRNVGNYSLNETASHHRRLDFCVYICSTFTWWMLPNDIYLYKHIYFFPIFKHVRLLAKKSNLKRYRSTKLLHIFPIFLFAREICIKYLYLFPVKVKVKVIPLQARCGPEGGKRYSSTLSWPRH